jgi:protein-S-isoprenylcysteine O-methyltransferase Ste14
VLGSEARDPPSRRSELGGNQLLSLLLLLYTCPSVFSCTWQLTVQRLIDHLFKSPARLRQECPGFYHIFWLAQAFPLGQSVSRRALHKHSCSTYSVLACACVCVFVHAWVCVYRFGHRAPCVGWSVLRKVGSRELFEEGGVSLKFVVKFWTGCSLK